MAVDPAKPYDLFFTVDPAQAGRRLDRFVQSRMPSMSRTRIQRYIARGRVLINDAPRRARVKVFAGDRVRLCCRDPLEDDFDAPLPRRRGRHAGRRGDESVACAGARSSPPASSASRAPSAAERDREAARRLSILYEDDDVVAVDKPAGQVVHPVGRQRHGTLINALYWRYAAPDGGGQNTDANGGGNGNGGDGDGDGAGPRIDLVNRLDRNTSGVVLAAKNAESKRRLQEFFEARLPRKTYLALCEGWIEADDGVVDAPIGPDDGSGDHCRMRVRRDAHGKPSLTRYAVVARFRAAVVPPPEATRPANEISEITGIFKIAGIEEADGIVEPGGAVENAAGEQVAAAADPDAGASLDSDAGVCADGRPPRPGPESPSPWVWRPDPPGVAARDAGRARGATLGNLRPDPRLARRLGARLPWYESRVKVKPHRRRPSRASVAPTLHTAYAGGRPLPLSRYAAELERSRADADARADAIDGAGGGCLAFTLVRLEPVTGRQHQLRVHMASIGHPLVADARYGRAMALCVRRADGETATLPRFGLHASSLSFPHPSTGRTVTVDAPPASDLAEVSAGLAEGGDVWFTPLPEGGAAL